MEARGERQQAVEFDVGILPAQEKIYRALGVGNGGRGNGDMVRGQVLLEYEFRAGLTEIHDVKMDLGGSVAKSPLAVELGEFLEIDGRAVCRLGQADDGVDLAAAAGVGRAPDLRRYREYVPGLKRQLRFGEVTPRVELISGMTLPSTLTMAPETGAPPFFTKMLTWP